MKKMFIVSASVFALVILGSLFYHLLFKNDSSTNIEDLKSNVESGQYDYNEGTKELNAKNFVSAEKHFLEVLKYKSQINNETYVNTLVNLGVCCAKQQKLIKAENYWKEAADLGDKDAIRNLRILKSE